MPEAESGMDGGPADQPDGSDGADPDDSWEARSLLNWCSKLGLAGQRRRMGDHDRSGGPGYYRNAYLLVLTIDWIGLQLNFEYIAFAGGLR